MGIPLIFVLLSAQISCVQSQVLCFVPDQLDWVDAQTFCRQNHIDLVSVKDQTDLDDVVNAVPDNFTDYFWIGLYRHDAKSPWLWSDQSTFGFTNWLPGQPNDYGGDQMCVLAVYYGEWNDFECADQLAFMCNSVMKIRNVRVEVISSLNVNDPALTEKILKKIEKRLKKNGLPADAKLSWKIFPGGNVFQRSLNQKSGDSIMTCPKNIS